MQLGNLVGEVTELCCFPARGGYGAVQFSSQDYGSTRKVLLDALPRERRIVRPGSGV